MATDQADEIDLLKQRLYLEAGTNNRMLSDHEEHLVRIMLSKSLQTMDILKLKILQQQYLEAVTNHRPLSDHGERPMHDSLPNASCLQSLRRTEARRIQRYNRALSPHKKVPPEVLTEIFSHCIETSPMNRPRKPRHMNNMPWVLLRVCSRWREVVKEAPFLAFQVTQDEYSWRTAHAILSTFRNSKLHLKSMSMNLARSAFVATMVVPFAARVTDLTLLFPGDWDPDPDSDSSSALFPDISFSSLHTLRLHCAAPPPATVFEILRRSPALARLTLLYDAAMFPTTNPKPSGPPPTPPIVLPNLCVIELGLQSGSQTLHAVLGALMAPITAPSLRHIIASDMRWGFPSDMVFPCGVFASLVRRSACSLTSVSVDVGRHEEEFRRFLGAVPCLRTLRLGEESKMSGPTLDAMAVADRRLRLLPWLEKLVCYTDTPGAFRSMVRLLIQRACAGGGLRGSVVSKACAADFRACRLILDALDPEITRVFNIYLMKQSI